MVMRKEILAIIPARGGSKSIPKKNIRSFAGHPLLAYSIAAGLQSATVSRVLVSTDDPEIADIGRAYGAETPFIRPAELAMDSTPDLPVFKHALNWLEENEGYQPEIIVQLRPTTPLRPPSCVDQGVGLLLQHQKADSVRALVASGQNPYKMWKISADGFLKPLLDDGPLEAYNLPRQDLPLTHWQTGHLDVFYRRVAFEKESLTGDVIVPLVLDPMYTVDIDTELDWERAEWKLLHGDMDVIRPGNQPRPLPERIELIILDFDGVMTDNRVWTNAKGEEWVAASRSDGLGIAQLRKEGFQFVVLSTEENPVVAARCNKLNLEYVQGIEDKASVLNNMLMEKGIRGENTIYLGNDVNDLACFSIVGSAFVVADAHPKVKREADFVLQSPGGYGAVRELCDLILEK